MSAFVDFVPLDVSTSARSTKKIRVPKDTKSISKYKGTSQAPAHANRLANLRDGTSLSASSKSPTPTESSSEEEGTSSEEESEDEEDDEMPLEVISDVSFPNHTSVLFNVCEARM